ncbi:MAG: mobile mystery protein B [Sphingorhabdus sp.]
MNDPLFEGDDDANTPLNPDERAGLIPSYIAIRRELNEAEHINIANADKWASSRKPNLLDSSVLDKLHERMFNDVWRWAGQHRTTMKNIGVPAIQIRTAMLQAVDDAKYWIEHKVYSPDEIAIRYSFRLVAIHPYPNGNGRFSRMVADHLMKQLGHERFSWGGQHFVDPKEARKAYMAAIHKADAHDFNDLMAFASS